MDGRWHRSAAGGGLCRCGASRPVRRVQERDSGRHTPADPQRCLASRSRKPAWWADRPTNSSCRRERSTDADGIAVPRRARTHPRPEARYFPRLAGPFDQGDRQRAAHLRLHGSRTPQLRIRQNSASAADANSSPPCSALQPDSAQEAAEIGPRGRPAVIRNYELTLSVALSDPSARLGPW